MNNVKKYIVLLFMILIAVIFYIIMYSTDININNRFMGTYHCDTYNRISIVVDADNNAFYIFDYYNNMHIKGIFEKQSNDSYFLSSHTKDYFQNQFITYKKSSFDIIIKL